MRLNLNIHEDLSIEDGSILQILPKSQNREDMICSEEIRLKFDDLNTCKIIAYITIF